MPEDFSRFDLPDPAQLGVAGGEAGAAVSDNAIGREVAAMMARPGVVMAGETLDALGRPALLVGVKSAREMAKLPASAGGFPVVVQVIGEVVAQ